MVHFYLDDCFLRHETGNHPERLARTKCLLEHFTDDLLKQHPSFRGKIHRVVPPKAKPNHITRVHSEKHIAEIQQYAEKGGGRIEADTVLSKASYDVALQAAGAGVDAVERVVKGPDRQALCLVRPPGHHAVPKRPMGFCLFNNIAVAAKHAVEQLGLDRVLIVDWDVHHGNGTQDMFWTDEQIGFFSVHRWPFYPGSGDTNETGQGKGLGTIRNLPVEFGTKREEYFQQFEHELEDFASRINPDLILISAGFDSHRLDPIGSLGLETEDFARLTKFVGKIAKHHCQGRIVSMLEGGYNIDMLPQCVHLHLGELAAL